MIEHNELFERPKKCFAIMSTTLMRFGEDVTRVHSKLHSIKPMATKVHVILRSFVATTWMHDAIELV